MCSSPFVSQNPLVWTSLTTSAILWNIKQMRKFQSFSTNVEFGIYIESNILSANGKTIFELLWQEKFWSHQIFSLSNEIFNLMLVEMLIRKKLRAFSINRFIIFTFSFIFCWRVVPSDCATSILIPVLCMLYRYFSIDFWIFIADDNNALIQVNVWQEIRSFSTKPL